MTSPSHSFLKPLSATLLAALLAACGGSGAPKPARVLEQPQEAIARVGDITIHANAVPTSLLNPTTAAAYGIERDDDTMLLIVAVRQGPDGQDVSVPAEVEATASTLQGQRMPVVLHEAMTGDLVDHVGTVKVVRPDTLTLDIAVKRDGKSLADLRLVRDFAAE